MKLNLYRKWERKFKFRKMWSNKRASPQRVDKSEGADGVKYRLRATNQWHTYALVKGLKVTNEVFHWGQRLGILEMGDVPKNSYEACTPFRNYTFLKTYHLYQNIIFMHACLVASAMKLLEILW